jgi:superfamily II DNA/RNA helicase
MHQRNLGILYDCGYGVTETMGLSRMTEIQAKTYAAALSRTSVLASEQTGTGKTLAYLVPALNEYYTSMRAC